MLIPLILLRGEDFSSFFVDTTPLFSRPNWLIAILFIFITIVTLRLHGRAFIHVPFVLILIAIPAATINGICEELLWRGLYVKTFRDNFWLAILYPAIGFALWHLVPQQILSAGNKLKFVLSTFLLGLAYGWIACKTGSIKWSALSHSCNSILALSGMIAPRILRLMRR